MKHGGTRSSPSGQPGWSIAQMVSQMAWQALVQWKSRGKYYYHTLSLLKRFYYSTVVSIHLNFSACMLLIDRH
jgi:hypothetical protein